jgi:DNA-binding NarL/FixJ family response regulator
VRVVLLTGLGDPEVAAELLAAGAADYVAKGSLSAERLLRSLRAALGEGRG